MPALMEKIGSARLAKIITELAALANKEAIAAAAAATRTLDAWKPRLSQKEVDILLVAGMARHIQTFLDDERARAGSAGGDVQTVVVRRTAPDGTEQEHTLKVVVTLSKVSYVVDGGVVKPLIAFTQGDCRVVEARNRAQAQTLLGVAKFMHSARKMLEDYNEDATIGDLPLEQQKELAGEWPAHE